MAEIPGFQTLTLRLIIIVTLCLSWATGDEKDNWEQKFVEIKTLISQLDSKISAVDAKIASFTILDYAFKTNSIDQNLLSLNRRADETNTQLDSIKQSLINQKTTSDQMNQKLTTIQESAGCSNQGEPRAGASSDGVVQKLDDYGKKLLQSHKDIKDSSREHHNALSDFVEVVKAGFSKVMTKFDSLLALEGQLSKIAPDVKQISLKTDHINDEVKNILLDTTGIKNSISDCTTNTSKALLDTSKAFSDIVTEVKSSISFPVSQLGRALADAQDLQLEMAQLTTVQENIVKAVSLSSRLLAKDSFKSLPQEDREMAQNLKKSLVEIENVTLPLLLSVPFKFENIEAVISDSYATMANRTQCHSDETLKLEIRRFLKGSVPKQDFGETGKCKSDVFGYCSSSIQDMVLNENPELEIPMKKLIAHLKFLSDLNEKKQSVSQSSDAPLRTLLG